MPGDFGSWLIHSAYLLRRWRMENSKGAYGWYREWYKYRRHKVPSCLVHVRLTAHLRSNTWKFSQRCWNGSCNERNWYLLWHTSLLDLSNLLTWSISLFRFLRSHWYYVESVEHSCGLGCLSSRSFCILLECLRGTRLIYPVHKRGHSLGWSHLHRSTLRIRQHLPYLDSLWSSASR